VRPDVVTVVEKWKSLEDLAIHNKTPHMLDYFSKTKDLEKKVKLTIMQTA
jgi:quinol monooxygenase YgiN